MINSLSELHLDLVLHLLNSNDYHYDNIDIDINI